MKLKEFKMKLKLSSDEKGTCKKYSKQTELIESPYRKFSKSKKKNQKMKDKDSPRYMQIIQPKCKDDKLNYETSDKPDQSHTLVTKQSPSKTPPPQMLNYVMKIIINI